MIILNVFEMIGTIAFAVSGALIGIKERLDLFGVVFLAITTAVGGGIFRDLLIGNTPPVTFVQPIYCFVSATTAVITCVFYKKIIKLHNIILITDAIGLGAFTALGANTALSHNIDGGFIIITTGLMTAVGGGILRDVFVKHIPFVFKKDIYAVASIIGGICFCLTYKFSRIAALYVSFGVTFTIRMIGVMLKLNLPVVDYKNQNLNPSE